jgi:uncharacterized protein involved in exopolysaccharide biosynthesis
MNPADERDAGSDDSPGLADLLFALAPHWKSVVLAPLAAGLLALGIAFLLPKTYLSRTLLLPPQQQQSAAAAALTQLGALSGLAGAAGNLKSPADQYVALLQSTTVADRVVDHFDLMKIYDTEFRFEARKELASNVTITLGKKDGLIAIEVVDRSPQRAADIANRYVDELRALTGRLALTEAQQRRILFEGQLKQTRDALTAAQQALQASGFSQSALRADARASAEGYARLRAEATAAEVRLQALRRNLADNTPEVQQALSTLGTLRVQLGRLEASNSLDGGPDYVSKFREFKYQETLFELLARQYEMARVDEAREGVLVQVVDEAKPAESKHRPRRALIAAGAALAALILVVAFLLARQSWRNAARRAQTAAKIADQRSAP